MTYSKTQLIRSVVRKYSEFLSNIEDIIYMVEYEYGKSVTRADIKRFVKSVENADIFINKGASEKKDFSKFTIALLFSTQQRLPRNV